MKKCITLIIISILLSACSAPKSNTLVKFYNIEDKKVDIKPKYENARGGYREFTCVDSEAIEISRNYTDDSIRYVKSLGTNCLEYDIQKLEAEKKLIKGPQ